MCANNENIESGSFIEIKTFSVLFLVCAQIQASFANASSKIWQMVTQLGQFQNMREIYVMVGVTEYENNEF